MGDIRSYLETSELGSLQKVFPALNVPSIAGTEVIDYLRAMAEASVEQIRFLNAFADVPLEVLYENIGQRHKASNIIAVSLLREIEGGTGEGLSMIRVQGEEGGSYENALISNMAGVEMSTEELTAIWGIQGEWISAEITRLNSLLGVLEKAEISVMPEIDEETARGIWSTVITKVSKYAAAGIPVVGQIAAFIGAISDTITIAVFLYDIYKRFIVERETLRNLPEALIILCKMTIDLLKKLRDLPMSTANFEMRGTLVTELTERMEQQLQFYLTSQSQYMLPSTMAAGFEQMTSTLETLVYNESEIDFGGVRVATRSKLITEP